MVLAGKRFAQSQPTQSINLLTNKKGGPPPANPSNVLCAIAKSYSNLTETSFETPASSIVTPYSARAISIVRLL